LQCSWNKEPNGDVKQQPEHDGSWESHGQPGGEQQGWTWCLAAGVFYNPAHHFTHTFAALHTTTDTLDQQATQAAFGLDPHPSIPQSWHPPPLTCDASSPPPLPRLPVALLSAHPLSFMSGVSG
jgi:hypothetical protein